MKMTTGLQIREMDLSDAQRMRLRNNIDRLEKRMLELGIVEEFVKTFRPKQERELELAPF